MSENVIEVRNLSRNFGDTRALDDVTLDVSRGIVFGLVGENGAGKTTLIKHLLGLFRAKSGSVRVFGLDPVKDPVGVLGRIGYLSEERDLPDWMRVQELMNYTEAFYPKWDEGFAEELRKMFELAPKEKIKNLSRGKRAQAGLMIALAHRPDLLLLDEPSSGLDPVVRQDILGAIIRTVADEGRTVFFSSHLLDEVERVADHVAMIHEGRMVLCAALEKIKENHRTIVLQFDEPRPAAPDLPGVLRATGEGREWTLLCEGNAGDIKKAAEGIGGRIIEDSIPSLEEIFVSRVKSRKHI
ncbi:ABC transporter ATP-binding protein [Candidatus Sumerlaeota bacterium]|nr:ABC transporter ATP-binding protein [Candidatus Sumerlaeota bacterium]